MNRGKNSVSLMIFFLTASVLFFAGCGGEKESGKPAKKKGEEKVSEKDSAKGDKKIALPEAQGPFDGGRLTFSTPKDWILQPRNAKYVVWFKGPSGSLYISAEDAAGGVTELTSENAREAVSALSNAKIKFKTGKRGEYDYVSYEKKMSGSSGTYESYHLVTLQNGRLYTFEICVPSEDMKQKVRDTLDAIFASAKFDKKGELKAANTAPEEGGFSFGLDFSGMMEDAKEENAAPEAVEKPEPEKTEPEA